MTPEWFHTEHANKEIEMRAIQVGYSNALGEIDSLASGVAQGWTETDVQRYLKARPHLLLGRHRTGHCTYAFSEAQLGNQYRLDWAVANASSGGMTWELIELESPVECPFKHDGHLSAASRKGFEQILNWRVWLDDNTDYAQRPKSQNGLGLLEVISNFGVVVVGKRSDYEQAPGLARYNKFRREFREKQHIEIISYDSFIESLRFRFAMSQV